MEENERRNYFMINLHVSIGPGRDRTRDPWICSQLRICNQTNYRLRYAVWSSPFWRLKYATTVVCLLIWEPSRSLWTDEHSSMPMKWPSLLDVNMNPSPIGWNLCKSDEREDLPSWQYPEGRNDVVSTNRLDVKHPVTTYFEVEAVMHVTYIE